MKIILSMAISANGIIASKTGSEEFLSHANWIQFVNLSKRIGCFIWGRKTYEAVMKWDDSYLKDLENLKKIIISSSSIELKEGFELVHSPEEAVDKLEKEGFQEAIITGGATLNSEFAQRGLIDEVIFDVNPSILGEGIPVFQPKDFELKLKLIDVEKINDEIVELRYKVKK
jgi:dihydrofolate reductase